MPLSQRPNLTAREVRVTVGGEGFRVLDSLRSTVFVPSLPFTYPHPVINHPRLDSSNTHVELVQSAAVGH